jgi:Asp/Glu/hydantoin racemase
VQSGNHNSSILRRLSHYIASAEDAGASAILVTGSTFSPAVDIARKLVSIPVLKIDEAMAEESCKDWYKYRTCRHEEATVEASSDIIHTKARNWGVKSKLRQRCARSSFAFKGRQGSRT